MKKFIIIIQIIICTILYANSYDKLTLKKAFELALKHNKELQILNKEIEIQENEINEVKLSKNPELEIELDDLYNSKNDKSFDSLSSKISFNKEIIRDKSKKYDIEIALLNKQIKLVEYQIFANNLILEIRNKIIEISKMKELVSIHENMLNISKNFKKIANERYKIGKALLVEQNKAELDFIENSVLYEKAQAEHKIRINELKTLIGNLSIKYNDIDFDFYKIRKIIFNNDVSETNPYIKLCILKSKVSKLQLQKSKIFKTRDFNFKSTYGYSKPEKASTLSFGIEFPLFTSNNHSNKISLSKLEKEISHLNYENVKFKLRSKIFELKNWLNYDFQQSKSIKEKILPKSKENLKMIIDGYKYGKFSYIELLDAKKSFFEAKHEYVEKIENYHFLVSNLEMLTK